MALTIDDETVRLPEESAALPRVEKIEAVRVALVNELRIYEASPGREAEPRSLAEGGSVEARYQARIKMETCGPFPARPRPFPDARSVSGG